MPEKILLYGHGGAYNHGAEAIAKTTIEELKKRGYRKKILLSTHFRRQDEEFGMPVDGYLERDAFYVEKEKQEGSIGKYNNKIYASTLGEIDKNTIGLSVGGDNYCYLAWHRWKTIHEHLKKSGARDILWSCSIDESFLNDEMLETLATHDLITVRESETYRLLKKKGLNNIVQCADVAFLLNEERISLPERFVEGNTIAINISPLVVRREKESGIVLKNIFNLIEQILETTTYQILLLSHVTMPMDNDEDMVRLIYEHYADSEKAERFCYGTNKMNAAQRKYLIARCKAVVAARTHASIAAYSSGVPVLAIGYSIKALGIARDMGMDRFLVPIEDMGNGETLSEKFWDMLCLEKTLRTEMNTKSMRMKHLAECNFESLERLYK